MRERCSRLAGALGEDFPQSPVDAGDRVMDLRQFRGVSLVEARAGDDDLQSIADVVVHLLDDDCALPLAEQLTFLVSLQEPGHSRGHRAEQDIVDPGGFGVEPFGGEPQIDKIDGSEHANADQQCNDSAADRHFRCLRTRYYRYYRGLDSLQAALSQARIFAWLVRAVPAQPLTNCDSSPDTGCNAVLQPQRGFSKGYVYGHVS